MQTEKFVQFKVPKTPISYGIKLTYDENGVLEMAERQGIRYNDRSTEFNMLNEKDQKLFLEHYAKKINTLPAERF